MAGPLGELSVETIVQSRFLNPSNGSLPEGSTGKGGGGQISGASSMGTGGPASYAKFLSFLKRKTHLKLRPRETY
jgi:hypothetical protein